MKKTAQIGCLAMMGLVCVLAYTGIGNGQVRGRGARRVRARTGVRRWYRPAGVYAAGAYGYGANFASTAAEGNQRGMAEVIRAQGEATESQARAMVDYEEARGKYLDNQSKWNSVYRERRAIQAEKKAKEKEHQQVLRESRKRVDERRKSRPTPRLSSSELDAESGNITWPAELAKDRYSKHRDEVDDLFALRAETGLTSELEERAAKAVKAMRDKLRTHIKDMSPNEYIAAKSFLTTLAGEVRVPVS
jgi:hypothetical protein